MSYYEHAQVMTSKGFTVDEGMRPLLEALWLNGIDTEYSCQGNPSKKMFKVFNKPGKHAYILFPTHDDGRKFIENTFYLTYGEDIYLSPAFAKNEEYRSVVRFPSELLGRITNHWTLGNPLALKPIHYENADAYASL